MPIFLTEGTLRECVERLSKSSAKPAMFDFLIIKRALRASGGNQVLLTEGSTNYVSALNQLGLIQEDSAGQAGQIKYPYFNPFAQREQRGGFRTKKYRSNGTNTNVAGTSWSQIVKLSDGRPRRVSIRKTYLSALGDLCLIAGRVEKPSLLDVACWYFRATDLESVLKSSAGKDAGVVLQVAFASQLGLTKEEIDILFRPASQLELGGIKFESNAADPRAYLAIPGVRKQSERAAASRLKDDDEVWMMVKDLLDDGVRCFMLSGPPGTGKTWYAEELAIRLADGDPSRMERTQFHPSYGYDDFIEGFTPQIREGESMPHFQVSDKIFLRVCEAARSSEDFHVLIIDEFTRGDAGRIFGEALTYIEPQYRKREFHLPYSGVKRSIPPNVVVLCTMNPFDKSVADIDEAMERRFAWIELEPSVNVLTEMLRTNQVDGKLIGKIVEFFKVANNPETGPPNGVGHAYFANVRGEAQLYRLWNHHLASHLKRVLRFDSKRVEALKSSYSSLVSDPTKLK